MAQETRSKLHPMRSSRTRRMECWSIPSRTSRSCVLGKGGVWMDYFVNSNGGREPPPFENCELPRLPHRTEVARTAWERV